MKPIKTDKVDHKVLYKLNEIVEWINQHDVNDVINTKIDTITDSLYGKKCKVCGERACFHTSPCHEEAEPTECELCEEKKCWKRDRPCPCWCHDKTEDKGFEQAKSEAGKTEGIGHTPDQPNAKSDTKPEKCSTDYEEMAEKVQSWLSENWWIDRSDAFNKGMRNGLAALLAELTNTKE